jgi:hypothetical protein
LPIIHTIKSAHKTSISSIVIRQKKTVAGYGLCVFEIFSISIRGLKIFQLTLLPDGSTSSSWYESESGAEGGLRIDLGMSGMSMSIGGDEGVELRRRGDSLPRSSLMLSQKYRLSEEKSSSNKPRELEISAFNVKFENTGKLGFTGRTLQELNSGDGPKIDFGSKNIAKP